MASADRVRRAVRVGLALELGRIARALHADPGEVLGACGLPADPSGEELAHLFREVRALLDVDAVDAAAAPLLSAAARHLDTSFPDGGGRSSPNAAWRDFSAPDPRGVGLLLAHGLPAQSERGAEQNP